MMFSKAQIRYVCGWLYTYVWLRVSNIWYGIKNILLKIPVEPRDKLLRDVK